MVKFTDDICETIYDLVAKGFTYKDICNVCGIDNSTLYAWLNRGKKAKSGKYKEFYLNVEKAKSLRKNNLIDKLIEKTEAKDDWKGYAWLLERGYGDEFARPEVKVKQEIEAKAEVEVNPWADVEKLIIESVKQSDEEKKKELKLNE